jgi:multisubunit Na+/H+ antiporter MnhE subunit
LSRAGLLDAAAALIAAALAWALVTGGVRPEDVFVALVAAVSLRLLVRPVRVPALRPRRVLAVGVAAYAVVFSFIALTRHWAFRTHALDLG